MVLCSFFYFSFPNVRFLCFLGGGGKKCCTLYRYVFSAMVRIPPTIAGGHDSDTTTAIDEIRLTLLRSEKRKEAANKASGARLTSNSRLNRSMLLVPQTAAAASKCDLVVFWFSFLSFLP